MSDELRRLLGIDQEQVAPEPRRSVGGILGAGDVLETASGQILVAQHVLHVPEGTVVVVTDGEAVDLVLIEGDRRVVPLERRDPPGEEPVIVAETVFGTAVCRVGRADGVLVVQLGHRWFSPNPTAAQTVIVLYRTGPPDLPPMIDAGG